jgi:hypothetical protein
MYSLKCRKAQEIRYSTTTADLTVAQFQAAIIYKTH